jgi:hypothetical protein
MPLIFRDYKAPSVDFSSAREADWKQIAKVANTVCAEIVAERRAQGKPQPDQVPMIHRSQVNKKSGRPILRIFNLSGAYPGRQNMAESMISGRWRLATDQEVEAEAAFAKEQRLAALPEFLKADLKGAQ